MSIYWSRFVKLTIKYLYFHIFTFLLYVLYGTSVFGRILYFIINISKYLTHPFTLIFQILRLNPFIVMRDPKGTGVYFFSICINQKLWFDHLIGSNRCIHYHWNGTIKFKYLPKVPSYSTTERELYVHFMVSYLPEYTHSNFNDSILYYSPFQYLPSYRSGC